MVSRGSTMARTSSTESSASSNIIVAGMHEDDSASEHGSASTPPTSMTDNGSLGSAKATVDPMDTIEENSTRRPKRVGSRVSTYNLKKLSHAPGTESASSSRNVSGLTGRTLVNDEDANEHLDGLAALRSKLAKENTPEIDSAAGSPVRRSPRNLQRRSTVIKERVKKAAGKLGSVLGKRSREVMEAGKRKLGVKEEASSPQQKKLLKELDMGSKGVLDEMDLSDDDYAIPAPRPAKKAKLQAKAPQDTKQTIPTAPPLKISSGKIEKKWQKQGLYVGQATDTKPLQAASQKKLQKKRPGSSASEAPSAEVSEAPAKKNTFMPLPMFKYLDNTRDFVIPFDIYAPSARRGDEKPKDWHKINRNRLVGEARELWERENLPTSMCVCPKPAPGEQGCGDVCLNRVMSYECNDENCGLPASECGNRPFAELAARTKKGGAFDVGVEVVKTVNRGFGVRSCRTFAPDQIIMEYTGEIISEGECQRRIREDYKDKESYYLMELEAGLHIDGTKGSMARFINHSCSPNCEVRMLKVNGTPRMAVFAGPEGIMTGVELTYDYNFDSFGTTQQKCHCGAANCRGTLTKRLNAKETKEWNDAEEARKRKAAEEAMKQAAKEAKKKQVQQDRGSSWIGWLAVDDPETKERLRREKREKEEAEKNSTRALRLAARRETLSAPSSVKRKEPAEVKHPVKRRKTTHVDEEASIEEAIEVAPSKEPSAAPTAVNRRTHIRTASTSSKFTEEFERPMSAKTTTSTIIKETTKISVSTTEVVEETRAADSSASASNKAEIESTTNKDIGEKTGLSRTASKGKEALKQVGLAVKGSILGFDKTKGQAGGSTGNGAGSGKLRQSTLSFTKAA